MDVGGHLVAEHGHVVSRNNVGLAASAVLVGFGHSPEANAVGRVAEELGTRFLLLRVDESELAGVDGKLLQHLVVAAEILLGVGTEHNVGSRESGVGFHEVAPGIDVFERSGSACAPQSATRERNLVGIVQTDVERFDHVAVGVVVVDFAGEESIGAHLFDGGVDAVDHVLLFLANLEGDATIDGLHAISIAELLTGSTLGDVESLREILQRNLIRAEELGGDTDGRLHGGFFAFTTERSELLGALHDVDGDLGGVVQLRRKELAEKPRTTGKILVDKTSKGGGVGQIVSHVLPLFVKRFCG